MSVYDKDGNIISGSAVTDETIRNLFIKAIADGTIRMGEAVGATLTYNKGNLFNDAWIENAATQYNAMKSRYKELSNMAIPFFVSTDQHSGGLEQHRWVNNLDKDGIEMANINLGDTVLDSFSATDLESYAARVRQVKNYISITGNHDALKSQNAEGNTNLIPNVYDLTRTFNSTYDRTVTNGSHASYTVIDHEHDVKYIVSDNYILGSDGAMISNQDLSAEYCEWLISELSKDDYDIIVLQHWLLHSTGSHNEYVNRSGSVVSNVTGQAQLRVALAGRKAKSNGTITDHSGNTHSYDFRNMNHNLLCMLSGHWHQECYAKLDGVLCYAANGFLVKGASVFGLVDRANSKLRVWTWDNTQVNDELVLDL